MQRKTVCLPLFSAVLLFNAAAGAEEAAEHPYPGEETRRWQELQSSGAVASTTRQTLSGPVAEAINHRFVDSFKHRIPEFYEDVGTALSQQ